MYRKVAFTMYPVEDMARARRFYEETLGLPPSGASETTPWVEFDLPGGGCLALEKVTGNKPSTGAGGTVALEVDDLDAAMAELKRRKVEFLSEVIHSPVCRMAVIKDSEGNSLLLHQLKPKSGPRPA